jgi:hypothetical protein
MSQCHVCDTTENVDRYYARTNDDDGSLCCPDCAEQNGLALSWPDQNGCICEVCRAD